MWHCLWDWWQRGNLSETWSRASYERSDPENNRLSLWPYKVTVSWWSNDMALAQNARDWGSIPHWGPKLSTHCDFDGQCDLRARSVFKAWQQLSTWGLRWVMESWCSCGVTLTWNTREHGSIPRSGSKLLTHCDIKRVLQIPWTCVVVLFGVFLKKW